MRSRLSLAVVLVACAVAAAFGEAHAQLPRVGLVSIGTNPDRPTNWEPFFEESRRLGYVEGRNITFERRFARGTATLVSGMMDDLVRLKVDVIAATGNRENEEARRATSTIPIVMVAVADPVASKLVQSLARPGGNTTGLSLRIPGLSEKWLQLLKDVVPTLTRVGVVVAPQAPDPSALKEMRVVAPRLGLMLRAIEIGRREDIEPAIATLAREQVGAVVVPQDAITFLHRDHLAAAMAKERLPAIYGFSEQVEAGGLMSYGAHFPDLFRRAASFVDRILKGAQPAQLPVEQPTKVELVVNLKAARALGLMMPPSIAARADRVIE